MDEKRGFFLKLGGFLDQLSGYIMGGVNGGNIPFRLHKLVSWLTPNGGTLLVALLLILTQQVWADQNQSVVSSAGPSANTMNYQGRLEDAGGTPQSGSFSMTFSLWDAATGGNMIWGTESHSDVPVSNGLFSVGLGAQTGGGIPTNVWDGDRYLQITIDSETLSPRELIRSVPLAGMALTVPNGAITSDKILDGAITTNEILNGAVTGEKIKPSVFDAYLNSTITIGSNTEVLSLNVDFPVDATYLIFIRVSSTHGQGSGRVISSLQDENGATITGTSMHTYHAIAGDGGTFTNSTSTTQDFSAGAHTLKLIVSATNGTGAVRGAHIIVVPFFQAP